MSQKVNYEPKYNPNEWTRDLMPCFSDFQFIGIRSTCKDRKGVIILSGQIVEYTTPLNQIKRFNIITFEPNFGFNVEGNNLADAYIYRVIEQPPFFKALLGNINFFWFNLTGKKLFK